jgi:hypothetical protein
MNFDTRTVTDLISLDSDLKDALRMVIDQEQLFSENIGQFNDDVFIESITPLLKDHLKSFLKKDIKKMELPFINNMINLNNIDYKFLIEEITKV